MITQNNFNGFPCFSAVLQLSGKVFPQEAQRLTIKHVQVSKCSFQKYFPGFRQKYKFVNWPFLYTDGTEITGSATKREHRLTDTSSGYNLKRNLKKMLLSTFRSRKDYTEIPETAVKSLMLFSTTRLCEKGFYTDI